MSVRVYLPTQKPTAQHNSQQVAGRLQRRIPEMSPHHSPEVPRRHVMHVIMFLGMLTCGAAVPRADVVCRPDPTILWKVKGSASGCPRVACQNGNFSLARAETGARGKLSYRREARARERTGARAFLILLFLISHGSDTLFSLFESGEQMQRAVCESQAPAAALHCAQAFPLSCPSAS